MVTCRLCLAEKKLIEAHLVPKCMYELDGQQPLAIVGVKEGSRPERSQIGIYDSGILCAECDNFLGKLDCHACEVLVENNLQVANASDGKAIDRNGDVVCYSVDKAEPEQMAKFVLSVFWRCHHSDRKEASRVDLGPHEALVREVLLGSVSIFETPYTVHIEYNSDFQMVMILGRNRQEGINLNTFYSKKFGFHLKTDQKPHEEHFRLLCLEKERPVFAMNIKKLQTRFGRLVALGMKKNFSKFGTPWK